MLARRSLRQAMVVVAVLALTTCGFRQDPTGPGTGVAHILPTVSANRILLKVSFHAPLTEAPLLALEDRKIAGRRTDSQGRFWSFDVDALDADHSYDLTLCDATGRVLHGPWPLATFPAPEAQPEHLRLLVFSCAGGHDSLVDFLKIPFEPLFQPTAVRVALLERGLSFEPDAVISNGDHVYWDLRSRSAIGLGKSPFAWWAAGAFDRDAPVLGTTNEAVLHRAVGPQIADLYGTRCQSVPSFFLRDDHDYFENDEASEKVTTFPPDSFMMRLARATQHMYYPEFLPDPTRPSDLPGSSAPDRPRGVSENFGTLRFGRLCEILMYDCCGFMSLSEERAGFVPPSVEAWLLDRTRAGRSAHLVHTPSTPVGYTAGKWMEWYPDVLTDTGELVTSQPKRLWQSGWQAQHDRLLAAASSAPERFPLFFGGDLHCIGAGVITRSDALDWSANPIVSILPGTLGTAGRGWPSRFRGVGATPSRTVEVKSLIDPIEENGFLIADFTPEMVELQFFRWHPDQGIAAIRALEPFHRIRLPAPAMAGPTPTSAMTPGAAERALPGVVNPPLAS